MQCEKCEKECEELVTREGFCMTYYIEWVCKKCFKDIEKVDFETYTEVNYYDQV